ncbi:MAG: hypothetical protein QXQ96_10165 [Sulfolobales archaeon]
MSKGVDRRFVEEAILDVVRECEEKALTVPELVVMSGYSPDEAVDRRELEDAVEALIASGRLSEWNAYQLLRTRGIEWVVGRRARDIMRARRV